MIYKHQFCLSKQSLASQEGCLQYTIANYHLTYHHTLSYTQAQKEDRELIILGDIYSYENPESSNQNIANLLSATHSKEDLFIALEPYCGAYVIIWFCNQNLYVIPDAAAQREVFYKSDYSFIASQVGNFPNVDLANLSDHPYYTSTLFDAKRIYIGDTTPVAGIKRLLPNHFLDTLSRKCERFYPISPNKSQSSDVVAREAAQMLKGFITAIHHRHEIVIPVTSGYDSRMLFLASLPLKAQYYISQHEHMADDHYEITTARRVVELFDRKLQIIPDGPEHCTFATEPHGVDYPRDMSFPKIAKNKVVINGNVSEVARNHYKYHQPSGKKLSYLAHFGSNPFVIKTFENWLQTNASQLKNLGYHPLDFFYWEENMANWAAKGKSETRAMDVEMISPFNSRRLLKLLHRTDRNKRDTTNNILHKRIIENLTSKHKELANIPINPDFERNRARVLWKLGLFKIFDRLRLVGKMLKSELIDK